MAYSIARPAPLASSRCCSACRRRGAAGPGIRAARAHRQPHRPPCRLRPPTATGRQAALRRRPPVDDPVLDAHRRLGPPLSRPASRSSRHGHVAARQGSNSTRPIDVLLESPYGGRTEPRIREHFDRLVDRISAYEVKALAEGDGFTEKQYEPASIDELLAVSATLAAAAGDAGCQGRRHDRPRSRRARHPDSAQPARAVVHRAVPGPAARLPRGRHEARQQVPADDSERLPRRRAAARSRVRAARRERVQAERAVAREGQGRLAVHARHRARERPAAGLVHRRAVGSRKGDGRRREVSRHARRRCSTATGTWRSRRTTADPAGCSAR